MAIGPGAEILRRLEKELTEQDLRELQDTELKQLTEQLWRWHDVALRELIKRGHVVPERWPGRSV